MKKKLKAYLIKTILAFKRFDPEKSILILSEARGGSTWLMEILAFLYKANIQWEPLHVRKGVIPGNLNLGWHPFIPSNNSESRFKELFYKIHSMKIHNKWTRKYLGVSNLFKSDQLLVKYVRANLMLPYFIKKFKFENKPIFLVRHPIDTCLSFIKAFDDHPDRPEVELEQNLFRESILEHQEFMRGLNSRLEVVIAHWCLNNCSTIRQLSDLDVIIVFYSDLVMHPKTEIQKIIDQFTTKPEKERLDQIDFRRSSGTDFSSELRNKPEDQLWKNIKKLSKEEKHAIQSIFDHFDLKLYTADSPFPDKKVLRT